MSKKIETFAIEKLEEKESPDIIPGLSDLSRALEQLNSLLQAAEKSGLFKMLSAFLEHYDDALSIIVKQISTKETSRVLNNALVTYSVLSSIDTGKVMQVAGDVSEVMNSMGKLKEEPPLGMMSMFRLMKDPDVSAGIRAMFKILGSLAKSP